MEKTKTYNRTIHIGHLIEERLRSEGRNVKWLSQQISCTRNHVYKIFNKYTVDCELLLRISKALQFDFFQYYSSEVSSDIEERMCGSLSNDSSGIASNICTLISSTWWVESKCFWGKIQLIFMVPIVLLLGFILFVLIIVCFL